MNDKKVNNKEEKMESSKARQMITLKNLPSNVVEEAIVILKANQKVKKLEYTKKSGKEQKENREKEDMYLIKEAEMVVTEYIKEIEKKDYNIFSKQSKLERKCLRLRNLNFGLSILAVLSIVIHFI